MLVIKIIKFLCILFSVLLFLPTMGFSQLTNNTNLPLKVLRKSYHFGDILIGTQISGGITNILNHTSYESDDTTIIDKNMYFYALSFTSQFYFTSYFALVFDYGFHSLRFDRRSYWGNTNNESPEVYERFFEQWFNRITLSSRFLIKDIFFIQTGPTLLINYNFSSMEDFIGIKPEVNDSPGVAFLWQIGLGASFIMGHKLTGDPYMTFDIAFYTYIPVVGSIIDSVVSQNAGGSLVKIKENPYQFELSMSFSFLL